MLSGILTVGVGVLDRNGEYVWLLFRLAKFWSIVWFSEAVVVALRPLSRSVAGLLPVYC